MKEKGGEARRLCAVACLRSTKKRAAQLKSLAMEGLNEGAARCSGTVKDCYSNWTMDA